MEKYLEILELNVEYNEEMTNENLERQVKKAYRNAMKKYHPDNIKTGDTEKSKEIENAYRKLQEMIKNGQALETLKRNQEQARQKEEWQRRQARQKEEWRSNQKQSYEQNYEKSGFSKNWEQQRRREEQDRERIIINKIKKEIEIRLEKLVYLAGLEWFNERDIRLEQLKTGLLSESNKEIFKYKTNKKDENGAEIDLYGTIDFEDILRANKKDLAMFLMKNVFTKENIEKMVEEDEHYIGTVMMKTINGENNFILMKSQKNEEKVKEYIEKEKDNENLERLNRTAVHDFEKKTEDLKKDIISIRKDNGDVVSILLVDDGYEVAEGEKLCQYVVNVVKNKENYLDWRSYLVMGNLDFDEIKCNDDYRRYLLDNVFSEEKEKNGFGEKGYIGNIVSKENNLSRIARFLYGQDSSSLIKTEYSKNAKELVEKIYPKTIMKRKDGSTIELRTRGYSRYRDRNSKTYNDYDYEIYEYTNKDINGESKSGVIYGQVGLTDDSFSSKYKDFVANKLLNSDRITEKEELGSYYVGGVQWSYGKLEKYIFSSLEEHLKESGRAHKKESSQWDK